MSAFGAIIPLPVAPALHPDVLALAIVYGLLTALAFALWPLGRAHDISVSRCCFATRSPRSAAGRGRVISIATAAIVALLAALAVMTTYDRRVAMYFVVAAAVVFLLLRLIALVTMWIARHLPRQRSTVLRLAIANIHRPGALTPSVMLSLGLGLALLVTVVEIDGNLHRELAEALPDKAPSFFFLDIPAADASRFDAFARATGAGLDGRARADAARPHRRGQWGAGGGSQAGRGIALGAARRPRHHLCHRRPRRFAHRRRSVVERRLFRRRRWCRSRTGRRKI